MTKQIQVRSTEEAMKLALEALERCVATCFAQYAHEQVMSRPEHFVNQTITAIREALAEQPAQPQQEPVAWKLMPRKATDEMLKAMDECSTEGYDERLYAGHASSVYMAAWDSLTEVKHELNCVCGAIWEGDELVCTPHPSASKPWVGLTDEEILSIARDHYNPHQRPEISFARAIEAKLKEKNT